MRNALLLVDFAILMLAGEFWWPGVKYALQGLFTKEPN